MILQRVLDLVTLAHVRGLRPGVVACSAGAPRLCPGPLPGALGLSQPALVEGTVTPFVTDLQGLRAQPFSQLDHGLATRCIGHKGGTARLPCLAAPRLMSVQSLRPCSVSYFTELGLDFLRCLPQRGVQPLSRSLGMPHLSLVLSPGAVPARSGWVWYPMHFVPPRAQPEGRHPGSANAPELLGTSRNHWASRGVPACNQQAGKVRARLSLSRAPGSSGTGRSQVGAWAPAPVQSWSCTGVCWAISEIPGSPWPVSGAGVGGRVRLHAESPAP